MLNPTTHPKWCKLDRCEAPFGGAHSDHPRQLPFTSRGSGLGQSRLYQFPPYINDRGRQVDPQPMVELVVGDIDTGRRCRADFTLSQTRQLERDLISTLLAAGDDS